MNKDHVLMKFPEDTEIFIDEVNIKEISLDHPLIKVGIIKVTKRG